MVNLNRLEWFRRQECLAMPIDCKLNSTAVIDARSDQFILRGAPGYLRSDNGLEFSATTVQEWTPVIRARTA